MAVARPAQVRPASVAPAETGPVAAEELRLTAVPTAAALRTRRLQAAVPVVPTAARPAPRWKPVRRRCRSCHQSPYRLPTRQRPRLRPIRPRSSARCAKSGWKTRTSSSVRPFLSTSSVSRARGTVSSDKEPGPR